MGSRRSWRPPMSTTPPTTCTLPRPWSPTTPPPCTPPSVSLTPLPVTMLFPELPTLLLPLPWPLPTELTPEPMALPATTRAVTITHLTPAVCPKATIYLFMFGNCSLFRRLIFRPFAWFSHEDPFNFDPGETRQTA